MVRLFLPHDLSLDAVTVFLNPRQMAPCDHITVKPHPGLNEEQSRVIQCDYGMVDGICEVEVRLSMAYYFIKRISLDPPDISPERAHMRLENMQDVEQAIAKAKEGTLLKAGVRDGGPQFTSALA
jgi:hypothetical protein